MRKKNLYIYNNYVNSEVNTLMTRSMVRASSGGPMVESTMDTGDTVSNTASAIIPIRKVDPAMAFGRTASVLDGHRQVLNPMPLLREFNVPPHKQNV